MFTIRPPILEDRLILGVIPDQSNIKKIVKLVKKSGKELLVVSVVNDFELGMKGKAPPKDWQAVSAGHYLMTMMDFNDGGTSAQFVLATIYEMKQAVDNNHLVFLHCKSGVGRSAMVAAAYLAMNPRNDLNAQYNLKEVLAYLKERRPQLNLHEELINDNEWDEGGCFLSFWNWNLAKPSLAKINTEKKDVSR